MNHADRNMKWAACMVPTNMVNARENRQLDFREEHETRGKSEGRTGREARDSKRHSADADYKQTQKRRGGYGAKEGDGTNGLTF